LDQYKQRLQQYKDNDSFSFEDANQAFNLLLNPKDFDQFKESFNNVFRGKY